MQSSTVKQAFEKTGIPVRTLLNRIKAGTVQAEKVGDGRTSAYLIPSEEVERLVAEGVKVNPATLSSRNQF